MKQYFFILLILETNSSLTIYAQNDVVRDGFIIQVDPDGKYTPMELSNNHSGITGNLFDWMSTDDQSLLKS